MSDSSDEEDSISKIDFSVISMAIEAGHKMVQQILNCVHYGTPEVRNLMYNECDFIVECRVCHNLFRSIPNFVAHKRIYCTAEAEQTLFPSSGQEESVVVVQPMDNSPGTSGSVSPTAVSTTSSQSTSVARQSTIKSTNSAIPTGSVNNAKSVLSSVFSSSSLSQSRTMSQSTSGVNVLWSKDARRSAQEQHHNQGQEVKAQGQGEKKEDGDSSDGDTSTLKQLLTGKFKGKSSEYNFYSKTAEKMERDRRSKEVSTVVMTPIPTNRNAAYLTVTKSGTATDGQNVVVSPGFLDSRKKSSESVAEPMIVENWENSVTGDKTIDSEPNQRKVPERSSKRKNTDVQKIVNEETATTSRIPEKTMLSKQKQMEQKNKKFVQLRPVKSQLGSHQYSELSELGLLGHCDLALSRCLLCSVSYCSRKGLLQHMHSIHSGRKILFPCSMCEKRFSYFWGLTRHLQNNHNLSKEKIDKIRDKLKSMAFDTADLEQEEHSDPKSRGSAGQNPDGSKQEKLPVKQTSNLVQTAGSTSRIQTDGETTGIKLNKCEGCKRAFWKKSNYDEHINQCKWLVTSSFNIDKSRSTSRSRSESSRGESTSRTTETSPNRPATRSKVSEKDVNIASSNVMDNLESIERRARSRTRSKVPIGDQAKQQNVSEKDQTGGGTDNKDVAMENDHEDSRDGSEFSKSSSTDRFSHKEKSPDQTSPVSSPSKRSDSSSPSTPSKLQMVTRHSAKSSEKGTQYMRTRFFDKRRESQIRPDKSPQSKTGSESDSPTLQKKDGVKVVLAFESEHDEKMNKSQEFLGSDESGGSEKTMQSISSGKDGRIDEQKLATKSRDSSLEGSNDRSEGSEAVHTRASRDSSRESLKETSLSRPSTRSVEKTVETSKDRTKSQTTPTSKRDGQKSPTEGASRDSSRESLKDGSSRVSTRSAFTHSATSRSRSRDTVEASPVLAKKDRQNSPVGKDVPAKRDSSTENENERSLSRTRSRNVSKSEDTSRCSSKESVPARISTRHTPSQVSPDNVTKNRGGTESEQDNKGDLTSFRASVRKSNRASVGMKTDKTDIGEKLKEDNVCKGTIEQATSEKTKQGNAREPPDSCQKLGGNTPGVADQESTGISDGNVQRVSTRSGKLDTKTDNTSEKHSGVKESNNLSNKLPSSEPETEQTEQSATLQSVVTRRSQSNISGQKDINKSSSNTRGSGLKSSEDVTLKETRSSGTRKTEPSKASGKSQDEHHAKGDHSSLNKNEGLELQKRSVRIREKLSAGKNDESDSNSQDSPPSPRKKVDEVDGESTFRSTRLAMKAQKMKCDATKTTEDVPKPTEVQVGSMIFSSLQPAENQNFLGLKVTPYTRKCTSRASSQFTPRIPKCLESDRNSASNTIDTTSDSKFEESTALERIQISDSEDKFSDSDESYDSSIEDINSDFISASPEPEVQLFEEIWVQKEPGLPTEEVKTNAFAMMTYKSSPTQVSSKGPTPSSSGHTTRASERMRTTRTQMYVTDPKNIGTSQESVQTRCLDLSRISYLSDEKEMKCLQCGLGFSCLSNLRRHVVRHLGWRRYKCKLCKFSSYNKSECNTHLIRSHGTKARNCTASTLIIDLNKEASKVRSQKKFNTIKSKTTGPSLRSRSPKKTLSSESEKTEVLTTETKLPESKKVSRVTSQHEKTRKGDAKQESFVASKTQSSDQSVTTVVATRSRTTRKETKMDSIEDSQSTKKGGTATDQSDADAAANLQMKTEELRRTRKRKRSNSEDTNSSKVEINKGEITVSDTKKSRKRNRSNSLEGCSKEEEAASDKLESLVVPIKKKYEMKRSTSLDGTSSSLPDDVGETLSDSWDIPSVSDFENSDTEICSPPIAKVVPNLETMMAALEEARAFKFVRQRGKGRKSLPLVKKTQRSGSLGSQADSHVEISTTTAGTSSVEGTPTHSKVLELSGVSSASLNSEGDRGKSVQLENITCTSREETDEETCAIKVNKISSDASNNEKSCVQNSSTGRKDNASGGKKNSSGEQNNSSSEQDSSSAVKESLSNDKDSLPGVTDNSSGEQDSSSRVKVSSASAKDNSSSNMDDSSGTKVSSPSVKGSSPSVKDSSSSVKDSSSGVKDSSSSVKVSSSNVKASSSSVKDSSSSAKCSSSSTSVNSPGVRHGSSGVTDSTITKDSPSDVQDSSMCKQVNLSGVEDSSSSAQISSISTKNTSPSDVTEITTKVSNVETLSCSRGGEHSTFEKETIENVVDSDKTSKAKEDRCKETVKENSGALHDPSKVVEECVSLGSEPSSAKGDNTSGQEDLGYSDVSMVTKPAIAEDVGTGDADKEKQNDGNIKLAESKTDEGDAS